MKNLILVLIVLFSFNSCTSDDSNKPIKSSTNDTIKLQKNDQLNITIVLDLSDRIDPTINPSNPSHLERDIEIVKYFTEVFKSDMNAKGAYRAKGKIKVILSPRPQVEELSDIISKLSVDLSQIKSAKEKKKIFDRITSSFEENLKLIYSKTIETKQYLGADIWRFFKNDVVDFCIDRNNNYRNILVIITDGYIYHKYSKDVIKNRSAYLTPKLIVSNGFRNSDWGSRFKSGDFGFIAKRSDLESLDILVLEINPEKQYKNDEDIIKAYLSKWFNEMNVHYFKLYNSDIPKYTKTRINNFLNP